MKNGFKYLVQGGTICVASALTWAQFCYVNSTDNCCDVIYGGPNSEPCGSTTCVDVILDNPVINYVLADPNG